jgi:protein O-GlcNAc transferase
MGGSVPKVSIGIPVFNEARFIRATIACLKAQTLSDFEVIIGDNCSTDETYANCEAEIGGDERFKISRHSVNIGAASNAEYVYRCALGNFFMWLGGHDLITDTTLYNLCNILDTHSKISMAIGYPHTIGRDGGVITERPGAIYNFSEDRQTRYLQSVEWLSDCTILQSLFRTNMLKLFPMREIISYDHILISRLLWHGNICYSSECKYIRRNPHAVRTEMDQMGNITGRAGSAVSRYAFARAYVSDFEELYDGDIKDREKLCAEIVAKLFDRFESSCLRDAEAGRHRTYMEYLLTKSTVFMATRPDLKTDRPRGLVSRLISPFR